MKPASYHVVPRIDWEPIPSIAIVRDDEDSDSDSGEHATKNSIALLFVLAAVTAAITTFLVIGFPVWPSDPYGNSFPQHQVSPGIGFQMPSRQPFLISQSQIGGMEWRYHNLDVPAGERVHVELQGNGYANLDMSVFDERGQLICTGNSPSDREFCEFTSPFRQTVRVGVRSLSYGVSQFGLWVR